MLQLCVCVCEDARADMIAALLVSPAATAPPDAVQRVNRTYTGLNTYYYNTTGRHWNCCGQTGGAGGASTFGCACTAPDGHNCLNCLRWWHAEGLNAMIVFTTAFPWLLDMREHTAELADTLAQLSPYNVGFARTMPWVYVDDYGWYVLSFLRAYELLGDDKYLSEARETFDFLWSIGWDAQCSGFYWEVTGPGGKDDATVQAVQPLPRRRAAAKPEFAMQKNAVTNLEMLQAAARLHLITGEAAYLEKAKLVWGWFTSSPLLGADGLIGDALSGDASVQCDCCNGTSGEPGKPKCVRMRVDSTGAPSHVWSYDQGMFIGAAALLYRATNDSAYAEAGLRTVHAVLSHLTTSDGVLREDLRTPGHTPAGPPPCTESNDPGGDFYSFKGVTVLQLADFAASVPLNASDAGAIRELLATSSDSAWSTRATPPWASAPTDVCADPAFAHWLSGPPKFPYYWAAGTDSVGRRVNDDAAPRICQDARTQISALSLFVAHAVTASR